MTKRRNCTFTSHLDYFVYIEWCDGLVGHIVHDCLAEPSRNIPHQPRDSGRGPQYCQFGDLTLLDDLHDPIQGRGAQDNWALSHPRVIHDQGDLVLIVPLNARYFNIINTNPVGSTRLLPIPVMRGSGPPIS